MHLLMMLQVIRPSSLSHKRAPKSFSGQYNTVKKLYTIICHELAVVLSPYIP